VVANECHIPPTSIKTDIISIRNRKQQMEMELEAKYKGMSEEAIQAANKEKEAVRDRTIKIFLIESSFNLFMFLLFYIHTLSGDCRVPGTRT
jgi:hypothetical protein